MTSSERCYCKTVTINQVLCVSRIVEVCYVYIHMYEHLCTTKSTMYRQQEKGWQRFGKYYERGIYEKEEEEAKGMKNRIIQKNNILEASSRIITH